MLKRVLLLAFVGSYLISLAAPIAAGPSLRPGSVPGLLALLLGSFSFFSTASPNWSGFSWLANPALLLAMLGFRWEAWQKFWGIVSLGLACLFFGMKQITTDEAGSMANATPGPGFAFWLQAMMLANLFIWARWSHKQKLDSDHGDLKETGDKITR